MGRGIRRIVGEQWIEPPSSGGTRIRVYVKQHKTDTGKVNKEQLIAHANGKEIVIKTKKAGKTGLGTWKKLKEGKRFNKTESEYEDYLRSDGLGHKEIADHYLKGNNFYDKYGKTGDLRDLTGEELNEIRNSDDYEDFLRYGIGIKDDKIEKYTKDGSWAIDEIPSEINADDLAEWSSGKKAGYEFDATGISPIEGSTLPSDDATEGEGEEFQYKQLLQESEFGLGEDKRSDYIDMLDTQDIYSSDMIGNMRTALDNIRSDEEDARQTYREASTGGGGYSDMLSELMSTFERGTSELNVDKESALKDLLQEYKTGAVEQRDIYTEDIGESIEAEKGLQASTGLEREDKSISDIVKGYMPDFEKQLESYQLATGATTEDIMGSYGTIKKDWREDVLDEEKKVEDAWGTLQESVYDPHMGQDLLTGLLSGEGGYYDSLKKEMDSWGTTSDVWNWME